MPDYDMKLGERLEVLRGEKRGVSDIQAFTTAGRVVISEPMHGEGILPVKEGDMLRLFYYRPFGMLSCIVTAERVYEERELTLIETELRSQVTRYQRREFVRFDAILPVRILPLVTAIESDGLDEETVTRLLADRTLTEPLRGEDALKGVTLDISGGGLRFICGQKIEVGTLAACAVFLTDKISVDANIRIVRSETDPEDRATASAKFIGMDDDRRGKIIRYIFEEQSRRKKT